MMTQTKHVLDEALGLSPIERAELMEGILSSFDFPSRNENDAAWAREAEDRIDAYDRGDLAAIPAARVFEEIEQKYSP